MSRIPGIECLYVFGWEQTSHQPDFLCEISLKIAEKWRKFNERNNKGKMFPKFLLYRCSKTIKKYFPGHIVLKFYNMLK